MAQQLCPEGGGLGGRVCAIQMLTFFKLLLRKLGPRTPPPDTRFAQCYYLEYFALYLGMDNYNLKAPSETPTSRDDRFLSGVVLFDPQTKL